MVQHHTREVPAPHPKNAEEYWWTLRGLASQLDRGAIYDRDIPTIVSGVNQVIAALERRRKASRRPLW